MHTVLTSVSPNLEPDDTRLALRLLLSPWTWKKPSTTIALKAQLETYYFGKKVVLTSSGRSALWLVLNSLNLQPGDEVVVQAFTCVTVPAAVQWSGGTPIYADIAPASYNMDAASLERVISPRTKAVIIQHTLGLPADMDALLAVARAHHLFVIEDCAHSFGATYHSEPVGSFGDAAILSFGRDKALSGIFGGAIITPNTDLAQTLERSQNLLPLPPAWWVAQQLVHPLITSLVIPLYFTGKVGRALLVLSQKLGLISKAITPSEKYGAKPQLVFWRLSPALAALTLHQFSKLHHFLNHRRQIAQIYAQNLIPSVAIPKNCMPAWLRYPYETENPQKVHAQARAKRMLLGDWYNWPIAPCGVALEKFHYRTGSCPEAEKSAGRIVNLPTHIGVTPEDAQRLIRILQNDAL